MRHTKTSRRGFSLTELVVVIAIIAVLISILIPVIGRVRQAARAADTRNQISRIAAAIERYRGDFNAYPGPLSNAQVAPATVALTIGPTIGATPSVALGSAAGSPAFTDVTSTENMVLGLIGGLRVAVTPPTITAFTYDAQQVGKGPMALNPLNPKQYPSYLDVVCSVDPGTGRLTSDEVRSLGARGLPVFVDRFQNEDAPRAILYLRAKTGAPGVVDIAANVNVNQYNPRHLTAYGLATYPETADATNDTTGFAGSYNFFKSASSGVAPLDSPNQKDGFILLSAGRDGAYGTSDDILSYSR